MGSDWFSNAPDEYLRKELSKLLFSQGIDNNPESMSSLTRNDLHIKLQETNQNIQFELECDWPISTRKTFFLFEVKNEEETHLSGEEWKLVFTSITNSTTPVANFTPLSNWTDTSLGNAPDESFETLARFKDARWLDENEFEFTFKLKLYTASRQQSTSMMYSEHWCDGRASCYLLDDKVFLAMEVKTATHARKIAKGIIDNLNLSDFQAKDWVISAIDLETKMDTASVYESETRVSRGGVGKARVTAPNNGCLRSATEPRVIAQRGEPGLNTTYILNVIHPNGYEEKVVFKMDFSTNRRTKISFTKKPSRLGIKAALSKSIL